MYWCVCSKGLINITIFAVYDCLIEGMPLIALQFVEKRHERRQDKAKFSEKA